MPYTSYAKFTEEDVHALYLYFTQAVKPVEQRPPPTKLPFPMNIRASMMAWNLLFLDTASFVPDPHQSAEWNRGAYLVQGAAHCSTCHTPRGFLMQEEGSRALSGGQVGPWYAPNITSDPISGIGRWTKEELVAYLRTGHLSGKAQASGSMGEAVEHSFQHLAAADLDAIATFIKSVPSVHDPADEVSRFAAGKMFSELAALRGREAVRSDSESDPTGAELFQGNCASCHSAEGQGSKDGYYPSLFSNSATGAKNASNLIAAILYGVNRTTSSGQAFMPGFGGHSDRCQRTQRPRHYGAGQLCAHPLWISQHDHHRTTGRRGASGRSFLAAARARPRGHGSRGGCRVFGPCLSRRPTTQESRLTLRAMQLELLAGDAMPPRTASIHVSFSAGS